MKVEHICLNNDIGNTRPVYTTKLITKGVNDFLEKLRFNTLKSKLRARTSGDNTITIQNYIAAKIDANSSASLDKLLTQQTPGVKLNENNTVEIQWFD